jgi:hypothetical protein
MYPWPIERLTASPVDQPSPTFSSFQAGSGMVPPTSGKYGMPVGDPQLARLGRWNHLRKQPPLLGFAIFATEQIRDQHAICIEHRQRLTWQGAATSASQRLEPMIGRRQMIAVDAIAF